MPLVKFDKDNIIVAAMPNATEFCVEPPLGSTIFAFRTDEPRYRLDLHRHLAARVSSGVFPRLQSSSSVDLTADEYLGELPSALREPVGQIIAAAVFEECKKQVASAMAVMMAKQHARLLCENTDSDDGEDGDEDSRANAKRTRKTIASSDDDESADDGEEEEDDDDDENEEENPFDVWIRETGKQMSRIATMKSNNWVIINPAGLSSAYKYLRPGFERVNITDYSEGAEYFTSLQAVQQFMFEWKCDNNRKGHKDEDSPPPARTSDDAADSGDGDGDDGNEVEQPTEEPPPAGGKLKICFVVAQTDADADVVNAVRVSFNALLARLPERDKTKSKISDHIAVITMHEVLAREDKVDDELLFLTPSVLRSDHQSLYARSHTSIVPSCPFTALTPTSISDNTLTSITVGKTTIQLLLHSSAAFGSAVTPGGWTAALFRPNNNGMRLLLPTGATVAALLRRCCCYRFTHDMCGVWPGPTLDSATSFQLFSQQLLELRMDTCRAFDCLKGMFGALLLNLCRFSLLSVSTFSMSQVVMNQAVRQ